MGNSLQAFGVFSRFRQDESPAGIGLDSYLGDEYAIFYKGKYFVVLQATASSHSILKQLAQEIESRILDDSPPPKEIAYFPKTGLKPGSIEYFPDGLLGHQFLNDPQFDDGTSLVSFLWIGFSARSRVHFSCPWIGGYLTRAKLVLAQKRI